MNIREPGVISREKMYFRTANLFTKENLLYILWGSIYLVDKPYRVKRNYMDAYMIQYIIEGELHFETRGHYFLAKQGDLVILNCKELNHYWAESMAKVKWFHFNGKMAENLVEYIYRKNNNGHFGNAYTEKIEPYINNIFNSLEQKQTSDFKISQNIYNILCELASPPPLKLTLTEDNITKAVQFMRDKYKQDISIKDVAEYVGLSLFYFTRLFKNLMGISPHVYLNNLRLENAKNLLTYTYYNIEEISRLSGFQSSSHFIRTFKKLTNITPKQFRKYILAQDDE